MTVSEVFVAFWIIFGFFAVLGALIVVIALIVNDWVYRSGRRADPQKIWELEQAYRAPSAQSVEFFRPRYARNRRA